MKSNTDNSDTDMDRIFDAYPDTDQISDRYKYEYEYIQILNKNIIYII
jgi:hypothetical protein